MSRIYKINDSSRWPCEKSKFTKFAILGQTKRGAANLTTCHPFYVYVITWARGQLRADVCKYRPKIGKKKLKKISKNNVDYPRYSSNEHINFRFIDKYFGDTANVKCWR